MAALRLLRQLEADGADSATPEQQAVLAKFSGWGSLPRVFNLGDEKFSAERDELRTLLGDEEYESALDNALNAHYTDAKFVKPMWDLMESLGFQGGDVLEAGSGTGNFIGFAPDGARMHGVEKNDVTAGIAKYLYPSADIRNESFGDTDVAPNEFDAMIGNVPFGNFPVFDQIDNPGNYFNIHDHFMLKGARGLKPGGVMSVVTSAGTMDKQNGVARKKLDEMGMELIGAVRLPNGAHQDAAGTTVLTDVLVLRKRKDGEPEGDKTWLESADTQLDDGSTLPMNAYYKANPENVLGETRADTSRFTGNDVVGVKGDLKNIDTAMGEALTRIAADAAAAGKTHAPEGEKGTAPKRKRTSRRATAKATKAKAATASAAPAKASTDIYTAPSERTLLREQQKIVGQITHTGSTLKRGKKAGDKDALNHSFTMVDFDGTEKPYNPPKTQADELAALLRLRDIAADLRDAETESADDTDEMADLRADLNRAYDDYAATFGPIGRMKRSRVKVTVKDPTDENETDGLFQDDDGTWYRTTFIKPQMGGIRKDATWWGITGLETEYDDTATPDAPNGTAKKAAIFERRTVGFRSLPTSADNPRDAVALSREYDDTIDMDRIADLLGVSREEAVEQTRGLVYEDHKTGELVDARVYLSGNVRVKSAELDALAAEDPEKWGEAARAMRAVVPTDKKATDITARLGMAWVPENDMQDFLRFITGNSRARLGRDGEKGWETSPVVNPSQRNAAREGGSGMERPRGHTGPLVAMFGTGRRTSYQLVESLLKGQRPVVKDKDEEKREYINVKETEAAQVAMEKIASEFDSWWKRDADRRDRLTKTYNELYRSHTDVNYVDSPYAEYVGMSDAIELDPHQNDSVAMSKDLAAVMLAHEVGTGKTFTMAAAVMEKKRLGQVDKPVIVVPNHLLEQFVREFKVLYPNANLLAGDSNSVKDVNDRRRFAAQAGSHDWDAVVMTKNSFRYLPLSEATQVATDDEKIDALRAKRDDILMEKGETKDVKKLGEQIARLEAKLEELRARIGGDVGAIDFENIGFDYVVVDEAHEYKNDLIESSERSLQNLNPNLFAIDLREKLDWLRETNPTRGKKSVALFATGTPVSNSTREFYVMMRFLRPDLLAEGHIESFDDFRAAYLSTEESVEQDVAGRTKVKIREGDALVNAGELKRLWVQFADEVTADDIGLERPKLKDGKGTKVVVPASDPLRLFMQHLAYRQSQIKPSFKPEKGDDTHVAIGTDGLIAAVDLRLLSREKVEAAGIDYDALTIHDGKLGVIGDNVLNEWNRTKDMQFKVKRDHKDDAPVKGAAQIVFLDKGVPGGAAPLSAYDELKSYLVSNGMKPDEVAFIHDAEGDPLKMGKLSEKVRNGEIKVLIGSTPKMGTGLNVQNRLSMLHHADGAYRPDQIEQRNGRVVRRGNQFDEVEVAYYPVEGSNEGFQWAHVARKDNFLRQFAEADLDATIVGSLDSDIPSEADTIAALGSEDPLVMEETTLKLSLRKQKAASTSWQSAQDYHANNAVQNEAKAQRLSEARDKVAEAAEQVISTAGDAFGMSIAPDGYSPSKPYADRATALEALQAWADKSIDPRYASNGDGYKYKVGQLGGMTVYGWAHKDWTGKVNIRFGVGEIGSDRGYGQPTLLDLPMVQVDSKFNAGTITRLENMVAGIKDRPALLQQIIDKAAAEAAESRAEVGGEFAEKAELDALEARHEALRALMRSNNAEEKPALQELYTAATARWERIRDERLAAGDAPKAKEMGEARTSRRKVKGERKAAERAQTGAAAPGPRKRAENATEDADGSTRTVVGKARPAGPRGPKPGGGQPVAPRPAGPTSDTPSKPAKPESEDPVALADEVAETMAATEQTMMPDAVSPEEQAARDLADPDSADVEGDVDAIVGLHAGDTAPTTDDAPEGADLTPADDDAEVVEDTPEADEPTMTISPEAEVVEGAPEAAEPPANMTIAPEDLERTPEIPDAPEEDSVPTPEPTEDVVDDAAGGDEPPADLPTAQAGDEPALPPHKITNHYGTTTMWLDEEFATTDRDGNPIIVDHYWLNGRSWPTAAGWKVKKDGTKHNRRASNLSFDVPDDAVAAMQAFYDDAKATDAPIDTSRPTPAAPEADAPEAEQPADEDAKYAAALAGETPPYGKNVSLPPEQKGSYSPEDATPDTWLSESGALLAETSEVPRPHGYGFFRDIDLEKFEGGRFTLTTNTGRVLEDATPVRTPGVGWGFADRDGNQTVLDADEAVTAATVTEGSVEALGVATEARNVPVGAKVRGSVTFSKDSGGTYIGTLSKKGNEYHIDGPKGSFPLDRHKSMKSGDQTVQPYWTVAADPSAAKSENTETIAPEDLPATPEVPGEVLDAALADAEQVINDPEASPEQVAAAENFIDQLPDVDPEDSGQEPAVNLVPEGPSAPVADAARVPEKPKAAPKNYEARTPAQLEDEDYPLNDYQQVIADDVVVDDVDVVAAAKAGTGKTSTAVGIAKRKLLLKPKQFGGYLAFNKSVKLEAERKMPKNVQALTGHGAPFRWIGTDYTDARYDQGIIVSGEVADFLDVPDAEMNNVGDRERQSWQVMNAVGRYSLSADDNIGLQHFSSPDGASLIDGASDADKARLLGWAQAAWADISNRDGGKLYVDNDHIRKMWALARPDFSKPGWGFKRKLDFVFLDEAQDTPPVLAKVLNEQSIQRIILGDADQAIYGSFTGSVNFMEGITPSEGRELRHRPLPESYRYGSNIADAGNRALQIEGSEERVIGSGSTDGEIIKPPSKMGDADAILVRSNGGMLGEALAYIAGLDDGESDLPVIGVPKGTAGNLRSLIESVRFLRDGGRRPTRMHEDLARYAKWEQFAAAAEDNSDARAASLNRLLGKHSLGEMQGIVDNMTELRGVGDGIGEHPDLDKVRLSTVPDEPEKIWLEGDYNLSQTLRKDPKKYTSVGAFLREKGIRGTFGEIPGADPISKGKRAGEPRKGFMFSRDQEDAIAKALRGYYKEPEPVTPDVIISTVHKAKGLEWDNVRIGDDFQGPRVTTDDDGNEHTSFPDGEEMRIAYVAFTRAAKKLDVGSLSWVYDYSDENGQERDAAPVTPETIDAPEAPEEPQITLTADEIAADGVTVPDVIDHLGEQDLGADEPAERPGWASAAWDEPVPPHPTNADPDSAYAEWDKIVAKRGNWKRLKDADDKPYDVIEDPETRVSVRVYKDRSGMGGWRIDELNGDGTLHRSGVTDTKTNAQKFAVQYMPELVQRAKDRKALAERLRAMDLPEGEWTPAQDGDATFDAYRFGSKVSMVSPDNRWNAIDMDYPERTVIAGRPMGRDRDDARAQAERQINPNAPTREEWEASRRAEEEDRDLTGATTAPEDEDQGDESSTDRDETSAGDGGAMVPPPVVPVDADQPNDPDDVPANDTPEVPVDGETPEARKARRKRNSRKRYDPNPSPNGAGDGAGGTPPLAPVGVGLGELPLNGDPDPSGSAAGGATDNALPAPTGRDEDMTTADGRRFGDLTTEELGAELNANLQATQAALNADDTAEVERLSAIGDAIYRVAERRRPESVLAQSEAQERHPDFGKRIGEVFTNPTAGGGLDVLERLGGRNGEPVERLLYRVEKRDGAWGVYGPMDQSLPLFVGETRGQAFGWAEDRANGIPDPAETETDTPEAPAVDGAARGMDWNGGNPFNKPALGRVRVSPGLARELAATLESGEADGNDQGYTMSGPNMVVHDKDGALSALNTIKNIKADEAATGNRGAMSISDAAHNRIPQVRELPDPAPVAAGGPDMVNRFESVQPEALIVGDRIEGKLASTGEQGPLTVESAEVQGAMIVVTGRGADGNRDFVRIPSGGFANRFGSPADDGTLENAWNRKVETERVDPVNGEPVSDLPDNLQVGDVIERRIGQRLGRWKVVQVLPANGMFRNFMFVPEGREGDTPTKGSIQAKSPVKVLSRGDGLTDEQRDEMAAETAEFEALPQAEQDAINSLFTEGPTTPMPAAADADAEDVDAPEADATPTDAPEAEDASEPAEEEVSTADLRPEPLINGALTNPLGMVAPVDEDGEYSPEQIQHLVDDAAEVVVSYDGKDEHGTFMRATGTGFLFRPTHVEGDSESEWDFIPTGGIDQIEGINALESLAEKADPTHLRPGTKVAFTARGGKRVLGVLEGVSDDGRGQVRDALGQLHETTRGGKVRPVMGGYREGYEPTEQAFAPVDGVWKQTGNGFVAAESGKWAAGIAPTTDGRFAWQVDAITPGWGVTGRETFGSGFADSVEAAQEQVADALYLQAGERGFTMLPGADETDRDERSRELADTLAALRGGDDDQGSTDGAADETADAPDVNGASAGWVPTGELSPGDVASVEGDNGNGSATTRTGHVLGTPETVDVHSPTGKPQPGTRTTVGDDRDGLGDRDTVLTPAGTVSPRVERDSEDGDSDNPASAYESEILSGNTGTTMPTDSRGLGIFPGSVVVGKGDRRGTVSEVWDRDVAVRWDGADEDERIRPGILSVSPDGQNRPAGWTRGGRQVEPDQLVEWAEDEAGLRFGKQGRVLSVSGDTAEVESITEGVTRVMGIEDLQVTGKVADVKPDPGLIEDSPYADPPSIDGLDVRPTEPAKPADLPAGTPTVVPNLKPEDRKVLEGLGIDTDSITPMDVQEAAARIRFGMPITQQQADDLAAWLGALANSTDLPSGRGRAIKRLRNRLTAAADRGGDRDQRATPEAPRLVAAGELVAGDMVALPNPATGEVEAGTVKGAWWKQNGQVKEVVVENQDGTLSRHSLLPDAEAWLLPDLDADLDQDDVPAAADDDAQFVRPRVETRAQESAQAVVDAAVGEDDSTDLDTLAAEVTQRLEDEADNRDQSNSGRRTQASLERSGVSPEAVQDGRDAARKAAEEVAEEVAETITATLDDAQPLPGESDADAADRVRDRVREAADGVDYDAIVGGAMGELNAPSPKELGAARREVADAMRADLFQLADELAAMGNTDDANLLSDVAARLAGRPDEAQVQRAVQAAAMGRKSNPGVIRRLAARIRGMFARARQRFVDKVRSLMGTGAKAKRSLTAAVAAARAEWKGDDAAVAALVKDAAQAVTEAATPQGPESGEPFGFADRVEFWRNQLPGDASLFGRTEKPSRGFKGLTLARLKGGEPLQPETLTGSRVDVAKDGGPGATALGHYEAVKGLGAAMDDEIAARIRAALPDFGDDPAGDVAEMRRYADEIQREERGDLTDAELTDLRVKALQQADEAEREFFTAKAKAVREALAGVRQMGPQGAVAVNVQGRSADAPEVEALRWAETMLPTDWLATAGTVEAQAGRMSSYGDDTIVVAPGLDSKVEGAGAYGASALRGLAHHLETTVPGLAEAGWIHQWAKTSTGEPGQRVRRGRNGLAWLKDRFPAAGFTEDDGTVRWAWDALEEEGVNHYGWVPAGLEDLFGDANKDDDLRRFMLGLLAWMGTGRKG